MPPEAALVNLEQQLRKLPHLIVIDNLETVIDLESLLPLLRRLASPTKFLLTTRHNLYGEVIAHLNVPELTEADALRLVRHEAQLRHLPDVVAAADVDLHPIYATVGGNPLALRLIVGQLHIYPLDTILADLRRVRGATLEKLYHFIYEHAWQSLNEQERTTLLALLLAQQPIRSLEMVVNDSLLTQTEVQQALTHLATLNLVESRGDLRERVYSLHGLTRTFLHEVLDGIRHPTLCQSVSADHSTQC
jgi:DNA-binding transcriptional ArsR family regulator